MPTALNTMNGISNGVPLSQEDESKYKGLGVLNKFLVSFMLKAALQLGIPDILAKAEGGKPLTAEEILSQLPTKSRQPGSESIRNLARTLRPLVWEGFFTESFNDNKQPVYGLTEASKWFVRDNKLNLLTSAGGLPTEFFFRKDVYDCYHHIPDAILDDSVIPFVREHGVLGYEYAAKNLEFGAAFHNLMVTFGTMEIANVMDSLKQHGVLDGVETLVDVGGGTGSNVAEIVVKNPQIKGINYDLPYVISTAPESEGMSHVPGSFMESVPCGDAMFVKFILHNYDDETASLILRNCYKALPIHGKVIISEYILTDDHDTSAKAKFANAMDINMFSFMKGAIERTKVEYEKILATAGFSRSLFIQHPGSIDLIISFKE